MEKKLVFENGEEYYGRGFGADKEAVCQVVVNTSMVGYQEILSDCSCYNQFVCMSYPLIGNYGLAAEDYETKTPRIGGFIVREYNESLANFRAAKTLAEEMEEHNIPGIEGIDTRKITRMLRQQGNMRALLCSPNTSKEKAMQQIQATPIPFNQVEKVSCKKRWYWRAAGVRFNVVAIDCGIKRSVIRELVQRGCNITIVPYNTTPEEILALAPDGIMVSDGPGNPADATPVIKLIQGLQGKIPLFGICLGHQLIGLANGCKINTLNFGCGGGNHPVKNLTTGKIEITSQSHSYLLDPESVASSKMQVTHINIIDNTIAGISCPEEMVFSVQYHPEGSPGPQDSIYLFDQFIGMMETHQKGGTYA